MKLLDRIDDELKEWLHSQHIFFVASAPLSADGHINCSPKGGDCFRVIGEMQVGYIDYTGSGAETAAHIQENGRIVLMFCAFDGPPNIIRLHGRGEYVSLVNPEFGTLSAQFPTNPGTRGVVKIAVDRVSSSCGFSIPLMDWSEDRQQLNKFAASKGADGLAQYRDKKNVLSIDGLPAYRSVEVKQ